MTSTHDPTEQDAAWDALRIGYRAVVALIDALPEVGFLMDRDGTIRAINRAMAGSFGRSPEALIGTNAWDLLPPDIAQAHRQRVEQVLATGQPVRFEDRRAGRIVDNSLSPVLDAQGQVVQIAVFAADITGRQTAEERLRQSEETLRAFVESTSDWVWELDADGRYTYLSPRFADITGYAPSDFLGRSPMDVPGTVDEDGGLDRIRGIVAEHRPFSGFRRMARHRDGHLITIDSSGLPLFDADGAYRGLYGVSRDVTVQVRQQQELIATREATARFASEQRIGALIEQGLAGIAETDLEGRLLRVNARYCQIVGHDPAQLLGRCLGDCSPPGDRLREPELFVGLSHADHGRIVETCYRRGDGGTSHAQVALTVLLDAAQQPAGYLALVTDITPLKETERRLRDLSANLERLVQVRTAEIIRARDDAEAANRALRAANVELERLATTDPLTNAWNRRHFEWALRLEIARARRYDQPLALLMLDIDHFKSLNDEYGHQAGDRVLVDLTRLLRGNLRVADVLARWGGEEFVILLPQCTLEQAGQVAEKLRELLARRHFPDIGQITCSIGAAAYRPPETLESLIRRADEALYRAKAAGRNAVRLETAEPV